ncbi:MAG: ABC transporter permease [Methanomassiliicoccales archaeon]|jgi:NitT/TauT family transport system permease protein
MTKALEKINKQLKKGFGKKNIKSLIFIIISLAGFVLIWWVAALLYNIDYFPTPDKVYDAFIKGFTQVDPFLGNYMWQNIFASLQRFAYGFALAFVLAVPIGLLMGFSRIFDSLLKPIIELFRPIPPIAWVPVFLIALGFFWGPVFIIFIGVFFPLMSSVYFGVRSVDPILLDAARTQGAGKVSIFSKVILPYTVPYIMTGIRIGLGIGWMCIVAAEMIGSLGGGIGYYIYTHSNAGDYPGMFAGIVWIALLGISTTGLSGIAEKRLAHRMGIK